MPISQTITAFPAAPNASSDTPEEFSNKADAFVAHQSDNYVGEVNTWAGQANTTAEGANSAASSALDSAQQAVGFASTSQAWAENPEDVPVDVGQYSALHWAAKASTFNPALYATKDGLTPFELMPTVLTDPIVSSTNYAEGRVTKFADGTMAITYQGTNNIPVDTEMGAIWRSTTVSIVFNTPFIEAPVINAMTTNVGSAGNFVGGLFNITATGFSTRLLGAVTSGGSFLSFTAMGRWK